MIELLLVMGIIALLASLLYPAVQVVRQRADSVVCSQNLRTIGASTHLYLQDHDFLYPNIETDPAHPIYPAGTLPAPVDMLTAFSPYGVTTKTLQCPTDIKMPGGGSYAQYKTSYDWKPTLDNENPNDPLIFGRRGEFTGKLSRIRQVFDDTPLHFGHMNALYADGHVVAYSN